MGDAATVFFRADGTWRDIRLNARTTGPGLDRLRRVPRRVGVAAGAHKVAALRAAMVGRLVTDVVVDDTLAWRLMTS